MRSHHKQAHGESIAGFEFTCHHCGETGKKSQIDDRDDHQFCSTECYHEWRAETLVGENSPMWEGRTVTVCCDSCGCSVEKAAIRLEQNERSFCSTKCHGDWLSENRTGSDAPQWKGGVKINYGPNWQEQREKALKRDGNSCVICGMSNKEHRQTYDISLNVHHVQPAIEFLESENRIDHERANRLDNLLTMCVQCHAEYEGIPIDTGALAELQSEAHNG